MSHLDASKLFALNGLVVVVTGGGSGLGRIMALTLAQNGASKVFILGRRADALNETASLSPRPDVIIPVVADITSKDSLESAYKTVASQTEYIDLLIANSGITGPLNAHNFTEDGKPRPIGAIQGESLTQPTSVVHPQVPNSGILSPPRPQVIITSSIGGFMRQVMSGLAYQLSKAAATSLIKTLSTTLLEYHIRINGIAAGIYPSDMTTTRLEEFGTQHGITEGDVPKDAVPLTRVGSEQDIAGLVLFMAGASGGYLNGAIVVSDGGRLASKPSSY